MSFFIGACHASRTEGSKEAAVMLIQVPILDSYERSDLHLSEFEPIAPSKVPQLPGISQKQTVGKPSIGISKSREEIKLCLMKIFRLIAVPNILVRKSLFNGFAKLKTIFGLSVPFAYLRLSTLPFWDGNYRPA